jgi:hypothetical protein
LGRDGKTGVRAALPTIHANDAGFATMKTGPASQTDRH